MKNKVVETNISVHPSISIYSGKVRDVYSRDNKIVLVASDRISAFDVILPKSIPCKGAVLNEISTFFLNNTKDIAPNWLESSPLPNVSVGKKGNALPIEVIVRGYIAGSMWREYENGVRVFCGVPLPEGLKRNQKLLTPIITPTTKSMEGHDENTTAENIISSGVLSSDEWKKIEAYAYGLFQYGSNYAQTKGLLLVDTKFEFAKDDQNQIMLIDEILTPDSSRYFIEETYHSKFDNNQDPEQLSKEFVRQWLIENNFMGREGDVIPEMNEDKITEISEKYIQLIEKLLDKPFDRSKCQLISSEKIKTIIV